jgi:hypothetical protein
MTDDIVTRRRVTWACEKIRGRGGAALNPRTPCKGWNLEGQAILLPDTGLE